VFIVVVAVVCVVGGVVDVVVVVGECCPYYIILITWGDLHPRSGSCAGATFASFIVKPMNRDDHPE